jgi:hypothetical protein
MELHTWLDLPENEGKATWLADELGCSKTAVSLWREHGVPLWRIPKIVALTEGAATEEAMLRHAMRCRVAKTEAA